MPMSDNNDGVALHAQRHPIEVTEAMLDAGERAESQAGASIREALAAIYIAMCRAAPLPPENLSEDSLEQALIEVRLHDDMVERFAMRCCEIAYEQKLPTGLQYHEAMRFWRQFVRELADDIFAARVFTRPPRTEP